MKAIVLSAILTIPFSAAVSAQSTDQVEFPKSCSVTSASEIIRVVVCEDRDLDKLGLVQAGKAACEAVIPCGAWIWHDARMAPGEAPENHDGLNQQQVVSSRAVWVAETESLIEISEVN